MGIVRPSRSAWASPVVIMPKPDGTIRFKMDAYPIPRTNQMLEVAKAKYISL